MKAHLLACLVLFSISCNAQKNSFWRGGEEKFEVQKIFDDERFPNVVVAKDGTVITTWGSNRYQVRRSEGGGETWGEIITVAEQGIQGGGTILDENSGDLLIFVEEEHPPSPIAMYRSTDDGRTWNPEEITIHPDDNDNIPSMHMNESGITLQHGTHKGRLIRPTRFYDEANDREYWPNHYTNAIYSDDGGKTWHTSAPFPANGTGEAALAELSEGQIYYNSRRHYSGDGLDPRMRHIAWSYDGGETWEDLSVSDELPDGKQSRDYAHMAIT